jgi:hypothetical protein
MKNSTIYKTVAIIIAFLAIILFLSSCRSGPIVKKTDEFKIREYKGYVVLKRLQMVDIFEEADWYLLKNDTTAIELRVPKWFGTLYNIGDTIK